MDKKDEEKNSPAKTDHASTYDNTTPHTTDKKSHSKELVVVPKTQEKLKHKPYITFWLMILNMGLFLFCITLYHFTNSPTASKLIKLGLIKSFTWLKTTAIIFFIIGIILLIILIFIGKKHHNHLSRKIIISGISTLLASSIIGCCIGIPYMNYVNRVNTFATNYFSFTTTPLAQPTNILGAAYNQCYPSQTINGIISINANQTFISNRYNNSVKLLSNTGYDFAVESLVAFGCLIHALNIQTTPTGQSTMSYLIQQNEKSNQEGSSITINNIVIGFTAMTINGVLGSVFYSIVAANPKNIININKINSELPSMSTLNKSVSYEQCFLNNESKWYIDIVNANTDDTSDSSSDSDSSDTSTSTTNSTSSDSTTNSTNTSNTNTSESTTDAQTDLANAEACQGPSDNTDPSLSADNNDQTYGYGFIISGAAAIDGSDLSGIEGNGTWDNLMNCVVAKTSMPSSIESQMKSLIHTINTNTDADQTILNAHWSLSDGSTIYVNYGGPENMGGWFAHFSLQDPNTTSSTSNGNNGD